MGGKRQVSNDDQPDIPLCAACSAPLIWPDLLLDTPRLCANCQESRGPQVLCNISSSDWAVHFVEGQSRIGPWLLFDSLEEIVEKVLRWGGVSAEEIARVKENLEFWTGTSVELPLTPEKRAALIARAKGWPWTGYELVKMKAAGKYPQR